MLLADDSEPEPPRRLIRAADAFAMVDEAVAGALDRGVETVADHVGAVEGITVAPEGLESRFETLRGGTSRDSSTSLRAQTGTGHSRINDCSADRG